MSTTVKGSTGCSLAEDGTVTQSKLAANVAGNGPAFSALSTASQSGLTNGTYTKVAFNSEEFDTGNCYDSTTNYRFQPTVAGYYQINCSIYVVGTNITTMQCNVYKNGTLFRSGASYQMNATGAVAETSVLVFLNGSTDYVEAFAYAVVSAGAYTITTNNNLSWFQGFLARAA